MVKSRAEISSATPPRDRTPEKLTASVSGRTYGILGSFGGGLTVTYLQGGLGDVATLCLNMASHVNISLLLQL